MQWEREKTAEEVENEVEKEPSSSLVCRCRRCRSNHRRSESRPVALLPPPSALAEGCSTLRVLFIESRGLRSDGSCWEGRDGASALEPLPAALPLVLALNVDDIDTAGSPLSNAFLTLLWDFWTAQSMQAVEQRLAFLALGRIGGAEEGKRAREREGDGKQEASWRKKKPSSVVFFEEKK